MKIKTFLAILFISIVLVGCGQSSSNEEAALNNNEVENVRELVRDYSLGNIKSKSASITSQQLIVKKSNGNKLAYDLSEEDFFVSIAPYVNKTHP
ncbi:hypothetical protein F7731_13820 [Cytobacillus depressus]|uniref:Uncharacterized protein n=2 Tax=Cytobacillus depressus TaxID=1602942 RepID=A0A6L3V6D2_9BACI|nr:hypothetical protein F7731_13820 [Cytobacillus depressus]